MPRLLLLLLTLLSLVSCKTPEARRPVSQNAGSFIDESILRNQKLVKAEEAVIKAEMQSHPETTFLTSKTGFWYYFKVKDSTDTPRPQTGDLVQFEYNLQTINGRILVPKEDIGLQVYQVDQSNQELMNGLRDGLKLMKAGETAVFYFPSHKAFGYYGYEDKIGSNLPVQSEVTLKAIKSNNQ